MSDIRRFGISVIRAAGLVDLAALGCADQGSLVPKRGTVGPFSVRVKWTIPPVPDILTLFTVTLIVSFHHHMAHLPGCCQEISFRITQRGLQSAGEDEVGDSIRTADSQHLRFRKDVLEGTVEVRVEFTLIDFKHERDLDSFYVDEPQLARHRDDVAIQDAHGGEIDIHRNPFL
jgi:hypothetical protein